MPTEGAAAAARRAHCTLQGRRGVRGAGENLRGPSETAWWGRREGLGGAVRPPRRLFAPRRPLPARGRNAPKSGRIHNSRRYHRAGAAFSEAKIRSDAAQSDVAGARTSPRRRETIAHRSRCLSATSETSGRRQLYFPEKCTEISRFGSEMRPPPNFWVKIARPQKCEQYSPQKVILARRTIFFHKVGPETSPASRS